MFISTIELIKAQEGGYAILSCRSESLSKVFGAAWNLTAVLGIGDSVENREIDAGLQLATQRKC
jgi:hypothetical protein